MAYMTQQRSTESLQPCKNHLRSTIRSRKRQKPSMQRPHQRHSQTRERNKTRTNITNNRQHSLRVSVNTVKIKIRINGTARRVSGTNTHKYNKQYTNILYMWMWVLRSDYMQDAVRFCLHGATTINGQPATVQKSLTSYNPFPQKTETKKSKAASMAQPNGWAEQRTRTTKHAQI